MTDTGKLLITGALVAAFAAIVVKSTPEKTKGKIRGLFGPKDRTGEECESSAPRCRRQELRN